MLEPKGRRVLDTPLSRGMTAANAAPAACYHNSREIGMAAMSAMLERIARPDMPRRDVLLECPLVVRDSCGARRAVAKS